MSSAKRLAREILDTRRLALGHATSPQLTSSALDGGQLDINDGDGNRIGGLGLGDDGGFVIDYTGGPKPPKPSPPTVTADAGIFRIEWDGSFVNEGDEGVLATSDTDRVEIHASMDENFVPDRVESFGGAFATLDGGSFALGPLPEAGTYYFRLVARSKSAQYSEPSDRVEQVLAITSIDLEITDAWLTGEAAQNTADGKNSIWRGPEEPEVDPDRPFADGDIWFEMTEDGKSIPNIWDETTGGWVANDDYRQSEIEKVQDELRQELNTVITDGTGMKSFYQPTAPLVTDTPGPIEGDLWFDTSEAGANTVHVWTDGSWLSLADARVQELEQAQEDLRTDLENIVVDVSGTTTYQTPYEPDETTDPQPKVGDLWFNTSDEMKLSRFDGDQWVSAADGRIDTIKAAQDDFASDLDEVRVSANGKSRIVYSDRAPTAEDEGTANDVWWEGTTLPTARNIVMVGDSITEGTGTSSIEHRWQTILQERLSPSGAQYPFIPTWSHAAVEGFPVERGGAVDRNTHSYRLGFGWRSAEIYDHNRDGSDPGFVEFTFAGTSADLVFATGSTAGIAAISVDGQAPIEYDTNSSIRGYNYGLTWNTGQLGEGDHTVRVSRSDSSEPGRGVWPIGLLAFNGDEVSGTRIIDSGRSGVATAFWANDPARLTGLVGAPSEPGAFGSLDSIDLVCLLLGTNDYSAGVSPSDYKQNYESFITASRAAGYSGKFLLVGMQIGRGRDPVRWDEYHQAMRQIAGDDPLVEYLDLRTRVPSYEEAPENFADSVHPSDAGHLAIADAIEPYIRREYVGGWSVTAQYVHDGDEWRETGIDGQVIANLDAGKIVSGYIDAARIKAGSLVADTVLVPGSAGTTVIQDGAITTSKIEAGAITAESGIIESLDAGTITVGEMEGSRIKAGTVTADKLLVGTGGNMIPWAPSEGVVPFSDYSSGTLITTGTHPAGGAGYVFTGGNGSDGDMGIFTCVSAFSTPEAGRNGSLSVSPGEFISARAKLGISAIGGEPPAGANIRAARIRTDQHDVNGNYIPGTSQRGNTVSNLPWYEGLWSEVQVEVHPNARSMMVTLEKAMWSSGSIWLSDLQVRNAYGATLIEDGAITTDKIAAGSITADSGIIGSINAGTITVGEMDGARIKAGTVAASTIAVGDFSNLATIDAVRGINVSRPDSYTTVTDGDYTTPAPTSQNYLMLKDRTNTVPFKGGESLRITAKTKNYKGSDFQIRPALWVYPELADGSTAGGKSTIGSPVTISTEDGESHEWELHIPESFDSAGPLRSWIIGFASYGGSSLHDLGVRDVRVYRMTGSTLIQDGAITTDKIAVGAITAESGIIGSIDANVITVGKIMGNQLDADAINGKTITGAKIRTASSGSRVELTHNGLKQYNSLGATIVDMTAGSFTLQGGSITGSTIKTANSGSRVEINTQGLKQYNSSNEVIAEMVGGSMVMKGVLEQTNSIAKMYVGPAFDASVSPGLMWSHVAGTSKYAGVATRGPSGSAALVAQGPRDGSSSGAYGYLSLTENGNYLTYRGGGDDGDETSYLNLTPNAYNLLAYNASDTLVSGLWATVNGTYLRDTASSGYQQDFYMQDRKIWTGWRNSNNAIGASLYLDDDGIVFYTTGSRRLMLDAENVRIPVLPADSGAVPLGRKSGRLYSVSSARRFKILEEPITDTVDSFEDRLLSIDAKTWIDKTRADRIADYETAIALGEEPEGDLSDCGGLERIPGVVAEDLEAAGLDMFVTYNDDGETESVLYDRIGPALIPIVRSLRDRIEALEAQLASA